MEDTQVVDDEEISVLESVLKMEFLVDKIYTECCPELNYYILTDKKLVKTTRKEWSAYREACWENPDLKRVGSDEINGHTVSTVLLPCAFGFPGEDEKIFETMVFSGETGRDIYCEQYNTYEEAEAGHKKAIQWALDGCKQHDGEK